MWRGLKSLKKIFGLAGEDTIGRRRVFKVEDKTLRAELLTVARREDELFRGLFKEPLTNTGDPLQEFEAWASIKDELHERLCALMNWPADVKMINTDKNISGPVIGFSGPELIPGKDGLYVTVPNSAYYRKNNVYRDGNQKVIDICESWTPPLGVKEFDSLKFGEHPVGLPRANLPFERFEKSLGFPPMSNVRRYVRS